LARRYFRTSFEPGFSTEPEKYDIPSDTPEARSWIETMEEVSKYSEVSVMASIRSPPYYMKNNLTHALIPEFEQSYYTYIRSIADIIKNRYNVTIERVSPINEPKTGITTNQNTRMTPQQLCTMIQNFNDPLISICPEKTFFWVSIFYANHGLNDTDRTNCFKACEIFGTHAYSIYTNFTSFDNFKLYYDPKQYDRTIAKPIWQMEVSSRLSNFETEQMQEAIDLASNVFNFVATMCVQRYYFGSSYTLGGSGESLIWGNEDGSLRLPKKYFAYKHFTQASQVTPLSVTTCDPATFSGTKCAQFGDKRGVFANDLDVEVALNWFGVANCKSESFCCTTDEDDWTCDETISNGTIIMPPKSVCSCEVENKADPTPSPETGGSKTYTMGNSLLVFTLLTFLLYK
jgi:hypothetical protein